MSIPKEELAIVDRAKLFVEYNASDIINDTGTLCEKLNTYSKLDKDERKALFETCRGLYEKIKEVGMFLKAGEKYD